VPSRRCSRASPPSARSSQMQSDLSWIGWGSSLIPAKATGPQTEKSRISHPPFGIGTLRLTIADLRRSPAFRIAPSSEFVFQTTLSTSSSRSVGLYASIPRNTLDAVYDEAMSPRSDSEHTHSRQVVLPLPQTRERIARRGDFCRPTCSL